MKNKIETFNRFNEGNRRPDRKRHMELCGFGFSRDLIPFEYNFNSPREVAHHVAKLFNELNKKNAHVVYFKGSKNSWGEYGYQYWVKEL